MFNQVTYNVVIERLRAFAEGHYLINKFTHGQISQTDLEQNSVFPWMHVDPIQVTPSGGSRSYQFEVTFADLPRDKEDDADYQKEAISDCIRLCEDLLAEVKNGHVIFPDADLDDGSTITPFIAEYTHTLSGATLTFSMTFPWNWSACEIPADWSVGGSGSGGGGGVPSALLLKVNGVDNVVQNILDLVEGTGINITDNGDGSVTITNTGGGGGSVAWGSIVGTLSSQTDLQDALDLKADISSLAAVATSGDYNDLDNLPTIPDITGLVPYTGATNDVAIGNHNLTADDGSFNSAMQPSLFGVENAAATIYSTLEYNGLNVVDSTTGDAMQVNASEIVFPDATTQSTAAVPQVNSDWNSTSGVSEILNKPTIPAAQVNSDWNAVSGVAQILNKPTIPAAQIQSDWTQTNNAALDYIKNKPTLPATVGDMLKSVYDTDNDGVVDFAEALKTEVRNSTGATLRKGYIIYLSGSTGNLPNAILAQANNDANSAQTFGVVYEDIANNSNGYVITLGQINTLDTRTTAAHPFTADTLVDGDVLYLSPTTAGWVTRIKPQAPQHIVYVGMVVRTSPTNGTIQYRIQNGYELAEIHDVRIISPATNDTLFYSASTDLWTNQPIKDTLVSNTSTVSGTTVQDALTNLNSGKQSTLVSGTSIKTINSTSLLGSGDLAVQATLVSGTNIKTINSTSILGSGNITTAAQDSISLINNVAVTLGTSTTSFVSFCAFTTNSVEASRQVIIPIAGTIKNLYVLTSTTQSANNSQVCTVRKNGANTAITTTIAASAAAGTFSDTTNSVSVAAGDKLSLQVQNNAASGTAATIVSVAIIIERS